MDKINLKIGSTVYSQNIEYIITKPISTKQVMAKQTKPPYELKILNISQLQAKPNEEEKQLDITQIDEKLWTEAERKFNIIKPFIGDTKNSVEDIQQAAIKNNTSIPSIYRWISQYNQTGGLTSLIPKFKDRGGKDKSRLSDEVEAIVDSFIQDEFLNPQKYEPNVIYARMVEKLTNMGLEIPHINTIRNRIAKIDPKLVAKKRHLLNIRETRGMPDKFPFGKFPMDLVEIDHTKLDIMLVDDDHRKSVGRPFLTVATDTFSRAVVGFYLSFEAPSFFNTGQCILNMMLQKDNYLLKMGVQGEWPVYGIPKTIHSDNGKELRGIDLTRFCGEYGIEVMWRPVGRSHFGGHIERLIGTISKKVHGLPGTTFSNITQKGKYDSEKNAAFTISEIEQWVLEELVNNYHKTVHSMIGMTPIEKYFEGVFGLADYPGTGLPPTITDSIMLRASLLPAKSRCIQQDGITIDHITYYSDVLRDFIEPKGLKNSNKTKHLVRRDPRDISKVYFYHQKIKKYFEIPYRNIGNPKMDLSELRASIAKAKEEAGFAPIEEVKIIDKHKKLKAIENKAVEKTKLVRRKASSKKHLEEKMKDMPKAETVLPRQTNTFKSDTQGDEIKPNAPKNLHVDFLDDEDEE